MKKICDKSMSFQECELAILRTAIDKAEERTGRAAANSSEVKKIINIVENFLKRKKLICYGGTAINNILPKQDQFYNTEVEIPDYDFFSPNALQDSKELTDDYVKEGFIEVEAKSGQHHGTFKVFVNFIPVADITFLHKDIYKSLKSEAIRIAGILYAPPNYLRMSMYLELSRPAGDVSRWEKVLKRLTLLNNNYPLKSRQCNDIDFQRDMENKKDEDKIFHVVRDTFINQGVVFFGGYAISLYAHYMPKQLQKKLAKVPDFDVLSEDPVKTAEILKERLQDAGFKKIKIVKQKSIGEIVAPHYQIQIGGDTVAFIYKPIACHSYNTITIDKQQVKVATIDTMLSFYLAFLYSARTYYDTERIVCMAQFLFQVQQHNRLEQKGLLRRFSINCYGHQETVEEMRAEKAEKFKELKSLKNKQDAEYEEWFLRYRPADAKDAKEEKKSKKEEKKDKKPKSTTKKQLTKREKLINKYNGKSKTQKRGRGGLFF
jgi:Poly(A) polymerase catalytic subunit